MLVADRAGVGGDHDGGCDEVVVDHLVGAAALNKRIRAASAERELTTVRKQEMWAAADLRPCPVMVWLPAHTGRFLDFIAGERLFALFCLVAYCGLRRDEALGLTWPEVDLDEGLACVRQTGGGEGPK